MDLVEKNIRRFVGRNFTRTEWQKYFQSDEEYRKTFEEYSAGKVLEK